MAYERVTRHASRHLAWHLATNDVRVTQRVGLRVENSTLFHVHRLADRHLFPRRRLAV